MMVRSHCGSKILFKHLLILNSYMLKLSWSIQFSILNVLLHVQSPAPVVPQHVHHSSALTTVSAFSLGLGKHKPIL